MNYKDLIDRLRATGLQSAAEAADVIESLTAQLASGPVAWVYEKQGLNKLWGRERESALIQAGWTETAIYHIPTEE